MNLEENELEELNFDKNFWTFLHLITSEPEIFLTTEGKIISKIVIDNGMCNSLTRIAKFIGKPKWVTGKICKDLEVKNIILINSGKKSKIVKFNEEIINEGLDFAKICFTKSSKRK